MKSIIIVNDDGVDAPGITTLSRALSQVADVYIVAPDGQRSCTGHGITMDRNVNIKELEDHPYAKKAFKTTGLPADCVKMGINYLEAHLGIHIDYVFSGINMGPNIGSDILYSGTIAGAMEGGICLKPSVAISVDSYTPTHFEYACELAVETFKKMEETEKKNNSRYKKMIISLNIPDLPREEIKGVRVADLGYRDYEKLFEMESLEDGSVEYSYIGDPLMYESDDLNNYVVATQNGYATITPLTFYMSDKDAMEEVRGWNIKKD